MATKPSSRTNRMKVTTVRFGADLWALLEVEAAHAGVSVSQYIREAALARAAFAAGARADAPGGVLAAWARAALDTELTEDEKRASNDRLVAALGFSQDRRDWAATRRTSVERTDESAAVQAQSRQTARRSRQLREARRERD
jgi:hypothetical protein